MKNNMVIDRFLRYVKINTQSNENSTQCPSSDGQWVLVRFLAEELQDIGITNVQISEFGYLYAKIKANSNNCKYKIGFVAHMDTSPEVSGEHVNPQIKINAQGEEIICTDGTTLLGADDKAGIAAIVSAADYLLKHPEIEHGDVFIAFTPDEEIGRGTSHFETDKFPVDWAYTIDGGDLGELEFENFNAARMDLTIHGKNVHPGYAKDKMVNSQLIACEIIKALSGEGLPENTEGYQGFFHLIQMQGEVEQTQLHYIIRDFDPEKLQEKKKLTQFIVNNINDNMGEGTVEVSIQDQYANMRSIIEQNPLPVKIAQQAMKNVEIVPKIQPIRGGTDGAQLSFMGIPCPNLFAGGINFHSKEEYIPTKSLQKSLQTIVEIIKQTATYRN